MNLKELKILSKIRQNDLKVIQEKLNALKIKDFKVSESKGDEATVINICIDFRKDSNDACLLYQTGWFGEDGHGRVSLVYFWHPNADHEQLIDRKRNVLGVAS